MPKDSHLLGFKLIEKKTINHNKKNRVPICNLFLVELATHNHSIITYHTLSALYYDTIFFPFRVLLPLSTIFGRSQSWLCATCSKMDITRYVAWLPYPGADSYPRWGGWTFCRLYTFLLVHIIFFLFIKKHFFLINFEFKSEDPSHLFIRMAHKICLI